MSSAAAVALPQGRAYEMVSPTDKNGGNVIRVPRAADDGDAIALGFNAGVDGTGGVHVTSYMVAKRTATGWTLQSAETAGFPFPSEAGSKNIGLADFDPAFTRVVESTNAPLVPGAPVKAAQLYRVGVGIGDVTWLSAPDGVSPGPDAGTRFGAASTGLGRIYFTMTTAALLPDAPNDALYEWRDGSPLRLVSVLPDGTKSAATIAADAGGRSGLLSHPGGGGTAVPHGGTHALSDDGSSIFWRPSLNGGPQALYLSQDGAQTRAVSEQQVEFVGATHDHDVAYITSAAALTPGASTTVELYRYDVATGAFTLLSGGSASGAQVVDAVMSDDGSHVYFTGFGALAPGAVEGELNAYVWSAEGVRFVGSFGPQDPFAQLQGYVTRVSRDGRWALLQTPVSMGGANNDGRTALYLYDADHDSLRCVSCRADGSASQGDARLGEDNVPTANADPALWRTRSLTDDGEVFFASSDRLLPEDINNVDDVYQFEDGKVSLLSTGRDDAPSYLADNSDDGRDVFIVTRARLVGWDRDELYDLYDVRVGGGFPEPVEPPTPCAGDDCQGPALGSPRLLTPGSTSSGSGNVTPSPGPKQVKRKVVLSRVSAAQRRALARGRSALLVARVTGGGRVTVRAHVRVGGRRLLVASGARSVRSSVSVTAHVRVRLTAAGRRALERRGRLRLTFVADLRGAPDSRRSATLTTTTTKR